MVNRTLEDHFRDWESHVFGFGYGTGEAHVIPALRKFLGLCRPRPSVLTGSVGNPCYDYQVLEENMDPALAWVLINVLADADVIEYGTSPRYGWLSKQGVALRDFILSRTDDVLYEILTGDHEPVNCTPEFCNCGPRGYSKVKLCHNPFWVERWGSR